MKVWLDDERPAPDGWLWCKRPYDVVVLLMRGVVDELSLDHDLGWIDETTGRDIATGETVLVWLERTQAMGLLDRVPVIHVHTANPVARQRMLTDRCLLSP